MKFPYFTSNSFRGPNGPRSQQPQPPVLPLDRQQNSISVQAPALSPGPFSRQWLCKQVPPVGTIALSPSPLVGQWLSHQVHPVKCQEGHAHVDLTADCSSSDSNVLMNKFNKISSLQTRINSVKLELLQEFLSQQLDTLACHSSSSVYVPSAALPLAAA